MGSTWYFSWDFWMVTLEAYTMSKIQKNVILQFVPSCWTSVVLDYVSIAAQSISLSLYMKDKLNFMVLNMFGVIGVLFCLLNLLPWIFLVPRIMMYNHKWCGELSVVAMNQGEELYPCQVLVDWVRNEVQVFAPALSSERVWKAQLMSSLCQLMHLTSIRSCAAGLRDVSSWSASGTSILNLFTLNREMASATGLLMP